MRKMIFNTIKKNLPTLLSIVAVGGVFCTAVSCAKASIKAEKELENCGDESKFGKVVKVAPLYFPAIGLGVATSACILGSNYLNKKEQLALSSAYAIANGVCKEYSDYVQKVKEIHGQEAHERIIKELAVEKARDTHITGNYFNDSSIEFDDCIEQPILFYDSFSNRYFESTMSKVLQAEYHINRNFCLGAIPSINDFYDLLGISHTEKGERLGWTNANGDYYWIEFDHCKAVLDNGLECYIIDALTSPSDEFLNDL